LRNYKYEWLNTNDVFTTKWEEITPIEPNYWFFPKKETKEYKKFIPINEIMPFHRQGIKTHRDWLVVGFSKDEILTKISSIKNMEEEEIVSALQLSESDKPAVTIAKKLVAALPETDDKLIIDYSYRPFDDRYIYYSKNVIDRPRPDLKKQMSSLALITRRNSRQWPGDWTFAYVTQKLPDIDMRGGNFVFPTIKDNEPNFSRELLGWLSNQFKTAIDPNDLLGYIYAILYSLEYRKACAEELRLDFPRIPFIDDRGLFTELSDIGKKLIKLHLLTSPEIDKLSAGFPNTGSDIIEFIEFDSSTSRVIINKDQWFTKVTSDVMYYEVGGYRICERWLQARLGRKLNSNEQIDYTRIVGAIKMTIEIQPKIDELYNKIQPVDVKLVYDKKQSTLY
jgi:predicted helicase